MTISRELRIPVKDVSRVAVVCKDCGGEMVIDLAKSSHIEHLVPTQAGGAPCPLCGVSFGQDLREVIVKLQGAFAGSQTIGHSVSFCVAETAIPQR